MLEPLHLILLNKRLILIVITKSHFIMPDVMFCQALSSSCEIKKSHFLNGGVSVKAVILLKIFGVLWFNQCIKTAHIFPKLTNENENLQLMGCNFCRIIAQSGLIVSKPLSCWEKVDKY